MRNLEDKVDGYTDTELINYLHSLPRPSGFSFSLFVGIVDGKAVFANRQAVINQMEEDNEPTNNHSRKQGH